MSCIAIDLHSDCLTTARRKNENRDSLKSLKTYRLNGESFDQFKSTLHLDDYVAIEASTNAFWFYEQISPLVNSVYILDVNKIHFIGNKTDNNDAKRLLDVLEYYVYVKGKSEIPCVYVPTPEIIKLRELFSTYRLEKKMITQIKNRIHSILRQQGYIVPKSILKSSKGRERVRQLVADEFSNIEITLLLSQLNDIEENVDVLVEIMAAIGNKYYKNEIDILLSIPGFTFLTSLALLADIGTVHRFSNAKKFCSYLRVAPVIKESNCNTKMGSVNKNSRSLTVTILTQSVLHFRKSSSYFSCFYDRLKSGKSYGKTRVALIRKILVCCYYMLKRGEKFKWSSKSNIKRKEYLFNLKAHDGSKKLLNTA